MASYIVLFMASVLMCVEVAEATEVVHHHIILLDGVLFLKCSDTR
jgi:hypothetical protein